MPYEIIRPYASSHLVTESALPLSALIHSFDRVENPWWLGGNVSAGSPGGLEIARSLYAKAWISAHDADKDNRGISVKQVRIGKFGIEEIKRMFQEPPEVATRRKLPTTNILSLASGEAYKIDQG